MIQTLFQASNMPSIVSSGPIPFLSTVMTAPRAGRSPTPEIATLLIQPIISHQ